MDYLVNRRSDAEIERHAERLRQHFVVTDDWVDIIQCLRSPTVWTLWGNKRLVFEICADDVLGLDDALTTYADGKVKISVKASVYELALNGDGRARNTLAHELGHAAMHPGAPKARRAGLAAIRGQPPSTLQNPQNDKQMFSAQRS
jgi:hypothetical protein